jgi:hypothetical protein
MHWSCFHFEFEHDPEGDGKLGEGDPDIACSDPNCPARAFDPNPQPPRERHGSTPTASSGTRTSQTAARGKHAGSADASLASHAMACPALRLLLARWVLEELAPDDVPALAMDALADGCDVTEVAVLAGLNRPTRRDVEDELVPLLRRLRIERPTRLGALKTLVDACAAGIVDGSISPAAGAHRLWQWAGIYDRDEALYAQFRRFIGLASMCEDDEEHHQHYEAQIVEEAATLLRAGGLRIVSDD